MADSVYDLSLLPPPALVDEVNIETIVDVMADDLTTLMPELSGVATLEGEPTYSVAQVNAYRDAQLRARINDAYRANFLAFAIGGDIDHLGAFYDVIRMAGESDTRLKLRIQLAIQGRSTGGTAPGYRLAAMNASIRVENAFVYREGNDPTIYIAVYAADNDGVADTTLLNLVRTSVTNTKVRMVNDTIVVKAAIFTVVNISAQIWMLPEASDTVFNTLPVTLRNTWALETGLGFDLTRSWLTARMMRPGVQRVNVLSPANDVVALPNEGIAIGTINLQNMGRDY